MKRQEDALPLLDNGNRPRGDHHSNEENSHLNQGLPAHEKKVQPQPQHQHNHILQSFDFERGLFAEETGVAEQKRQPRQVARPKRLLLATPAPFEPITDPFAFVCDIARRPKFGHQYILCPNRSRRQRGDGVGLSVGPHWSGVIYTISIIGVVTLALVRFIMNDVAPWCQPVTVACSLVTVGFLLATAVADPGIVVASAEGGEGCAYCAECSIWKPDGAEHCEEW